MCKTRFNFNHVMLGCGWTISVRTLSLIIYVTLSDYTDSVAESYILKNVLAKIVFKYKISAVN